MTLWQLFAPSPVPLRDDTPDGVRVFVDGVARALPGNETFVAPLRNEPCVVGHVAYTIPNRQNQRGAPTKFERIHNRPVAVDGERADAIVDAAHLELRVPKLVNAMMTEKSVPVGARIRVVGIVMRDGGTLDQVDAPFREAAPVLKIVGSRRHPVTVAML